MTLLATAAQYRAQLMAHEAATMRTLEAVHAHMVHSLTPHLSTLYDALATAQQHSSGKPSPTFLYQGKRLAHVTQAVDHAVGQYATFTQATITQSQQVASHLAARSTLAQLGYVLPPAQHMTANTPDVTKQLSTATDNTASLVASYAHDAAIAVKVAFVVGVSLGSTVKAIDKQVTRALDASRWRSVTVAATAPVQVYRATTLTILDANFIPGWVWTTDKTASVCDVCFAMDGTQHPIDEDMESHPNCFPAGTVVAAQDIQAATKRWYEGDLVEITTSLGYHLRGTPNHPILTDRGWIGIGFLQKGDNVICGSLNERISRGYPDVENVPAKIGDIFDTLANQWGIQRVPITHTDFHGDVRHDGYVDIVTVQGELRISRNASLSKEVNEPLLVGSNQPRLSLSCHGSPVGSSTVLTHSSSGGLGRNSEPPLFFRGSPGLLNTIGFTSATNGNITLNQSTPDGWSADIQAFRESLFRFASQVGRDKIINIKRDAFQGHVYNLQTNSEKYIVNNAIVPYIGNNSNIGIITHNCHCIPIPLNDLQPIN